MIGILTRGLLAIDAAVFDLDGSARVAAALHGPRGEPESLGLRAAEALVLKVPSLYLNGVLDPAITFDGYVCCRDTTTRDFASQRVCPNRYHTREGKLPFKGTRLPDDVDVTNKVGRLVEPAGETQQVRPVTTVGVRQAGRPSLMVTFRTPKTWPRHAARWLRELVRPHFVISSRV